MSYFSLATLTARENVFISPMHLAGHCEKGPQEATIRSYKLWGSAWIIKKRMD